MESQVKSQITNKLYTTQLEKIEEEDRDANSELYKISVSGYDIRVAPGKTIMDESGIAYCYVYVIQKDKVVCKLGVYEKKTDTMPMLFDLSSFPEGSLLLFEEYEMNPSKLVDLEMKETETNNVFDYLIRELFPKIEDKKKRLNSAYKLLYDIFSKDSQDTDMKPILRIMSTVRKEEPTETFLQTLKDKATDKTKFVLTLLALQPFFMVDFDLETENARAYLTYKELKTRWKVVDVTKKIVVNVDTYEMREKDTGLSVIQEEPSIIEETAPKQVESVAEVEEVAEVAEEVEPVYEPIAEVAEVEEPVAEMEEEVAEVEEPVVEVEPSIMEEIEPAVKASVSRPKPVRKGTTPKKIEPSAEPSAEPVVSPAVSAIKKERRRTPKVGTVPRGTSMNTVIEQPSISLNEPTIGMSLNDVTQTSDIGTLKKTRKKGTPKLETAEETDTPKLETTKLKIKRIPKPKPKSEL